MNIRIILFDVDNTLYSKDIGIFNAVDQRINYYLIKFLKIPEKKVNYLRKFYMERYGTTLNGLIKFYNIDPFHYLDFVHDIPLEKYLKEDNKLQYYLENIKVKKVIFSNAYEPYIRLILKKLGIEKYFEEIFCIKKLNFYPKPHELPYFQIINYFKEKSKNFLMIDDNYRNLLTAKKLNIKTGYICYEKSIEWQLFDISSKNIYEILEKLNYLL